LTTDKTVQYFNHENKLYRSPPPFSDCCLILRRRLGSDLVTKPQHLTTTHKMKTSTTDIEQGLRNVATRMDNAEAAFLETLMTFGEILRPEAVQVLALYRKHRLVKMDAVGGTISVKHGSFLDRETIRHALVLSELEKMN